jgi:hypothetical protein
MNRTIIQQEGMMTLWFSTSGLCDSILIDGLTKFNNLLAIVRNDESILRFKG